MNRLNLLLLSAISLGLSGCELIGGIFRAGIWVGVIVVLIVLALVWWIASQFRGRGSAP